ncbi:2OG-Fe(II) oxygenase [Thiocystis violacea]|uniref:2OG-Fe(II) oxygenase n=1 Tax=Thiocystis violacea TaxID=13725 RepID=UPI0019034D14|nr:2OG-Fe(II) oxygenase [Thiocystis violacea]MBK1722757.1 hypothetical protein [Thiocystis violacea]
MLNLQEDLAQVLSRVQRPGDFYATGTLDIHPPRLIVDGVGTLALPLLPVQAEQLIAIAEQAPYGRGSETLVDTEVRRTWQIDGARVRLEGRRWADDLAQIIAEVSAGLGVKGQVAAELYKLLVYDTGSFFVSHRDTEKAPGMFATLVLVLPSEYSGGELIIRHKGHEVALDLRRSEPSEVAYAAFYADCRHEVLPIEAGCRLALVYNLLRPDGEPLPVAPDHDAEQQAVAELLRHWGAVAATEVLPLKHTEPLKLIYPLEHSYTEAELSFSTLKGADAAVAGVLHGAAREAECDLHLALVTIRETGWAEYGGGGRYWDDDEARYEIGEVEETSQEVWHWRRPDGALSDMGALSFTDEEVCPPDAFADLEDTEPDFEEATGNAGVSFERLYQRAALVLWPRGERSAVLAKGGLSVSLPFLSALVAQWQQAGGAPDDALWQEARALAMRIRDRWPEQDWQRQQASRSGQGAALLDALTLLGEMRAAAAFIATNGVTGAYSAADNPTIAAALRALPADQAADLLTGVIANNTARQPAACAGLLALCTERLADVSATLRTPALALLAALPTLSEGAAVRDSAQRPTPELVIYALVGLERIDSALAERAVEHCLSWPHAYAMDSVILPALTALDALSAKDAAKGEAAAVSRLRRALLDHLDRRLAEPLAPPADWARPAQVRCSCRDCAQLTVFLASPTEPVWRFKANEPQRKHLEQSVRANRCDLDLATETRGRPYTLVCTKNQASYERRLRQREQDLTDRERLGRGQ